MSRSYFSITMEVTKNKAVKIARVFELIMTSCHFCDASSSYDISSSYVTCIQPSTYFFYCDRAIAFATLFHLRQTDRQEFHFASSCENS